MRIKDKNINKIPLILIICVVIIAISGISIFAISNQQNDSKSKDTKSSQNNQTSEQTDEEKQTEKNLDNQSKQDFLDGQTEQGSSPTPPNNTSVAIETKVESNNTVTVLSKLNSIPSGTCNLVITSGGKEKRLSAEVMYQPEYSTCAGFSIDKSALPSGEWKASLEVISQGKTYKAEKNITIN